MKIKDVIKKNVALTVTNASQIK